VLNFRRTKIKRGSWFKKEVVYKIRNVFGSKELKKFEADETE
jgi:hypothetical protein